MKIFDFFSLSEFNFFFFVNYGQKKKTFLFINCCDFYFNFKYFSSIYSFFSLSFIFSLIPNYRSKDNNFEFFANIFNLFENNAIDNIFIIRHKNCKYINLFKNNLCSDFLLFNWLLFNFNQSEIYKIKNLSEKRINEFLFYKIKENFNSFFFSFKKKNIVFKNIYFNF